MTSSRCSMQLSSAGTRRRDSGGQLAIIISMFSSSPFSSSSSYHDAVIWRRSSGSSFADSNERVESSSRIDQSAKTNTPAAHWSPRPSANIIIIYCRQPPVQPSILPPVNQSFSQSVTVEGVCVCVCFDVRQWVSRAILPL